MADPDPQNADLIWSRKVVSIAINTCVVAKALPAELAERCIEIAAEEINIRLMIGDRPPANK
jgi:hypothetical protein